MVCNALERDPENEHAIVNPVVLVEVLSSSTETYDRNDKWAHYRRIPSLREYVLLSQKEPRIEVYTRRDGRWELTEYRTGEAALIGSLDVMLPVDLVYHDPLA